MSKYSKYPWAISGNPILFQTSTGSVHAVTAGDSNIDHEKVKIKYSKFRFSKKFGNLRVKPIKIGSHQKAILLHILHNKGDCRGIRCEHCILSDLLDCSDLQDDDKVRFLYKLLPEDIMFEELL